MRVTADQSVCVGASNCVFAAADVFDQGEDDGLVVLLQETVPVGLQDDVRNAIRYCPSGAIKEVTE